MYYVYNKKNNNNIKTTVRAGLRRRGDGVSSIIYLHIIIIAVW